MNVTAPEHKTIVKIIVKIELIHRLATAGNNESYAIYCVFYTASTVFMPWHQSWFPLFFIAHAISLSVESSHTHTDCCFLCFMIKAEEMGTARHAREGLPSY